MTKNLRVAVAAAGLAFAILCSALGVSSAAGVQQLSTPKNGSTLLSLGKAPEKKAIVLNLGALRLGEAKLPPGPLTLAERNRMRIRAAVQIEDAVSRARRDRLANRNAPAPTRENDDQESRQQEERPAPGDIPDDEARQDDDDVEVTDVAENDSDDGGVDDAVEDPETPVFE